MTDHLLALAISIAVAIAVALYPFGVAWLYLHLGG